MSRVLLPRLRDFFKKVAEVLLPGDIRDLPELKDRASYLWRSLKGKVCVDKTPMEENTKTDSDCEKGNPFT